MTHRPVEAEEFIEGEDGAMKVAETIIEHLRKYGPAARVAVCASRQETLVTFQDGELAQYAGELSQADGAARSQMTHIGGGVIRFLVPYTHTMLRGPQWSLIVFDTSVGAGLTDHHIKDFRDSIRRGLQIGPRVEIESDNWEHETAQ